jgi:uncharacterized membrane protein
MTRKALPMGSSFGIGGALAWLTQASPALAQPGERYWGPNIMWGGWFHMFFGFLMMLLFLGIMVVLIVLSVRWLVAPSIAVLPFDASGRACRARHSQGAVRARRARRRRVRGAPPRARRVNGSPEDARLPTSARERLSFRFPRDRLMRRLT